MGRLKNAVLWESWRARLRRFEDSGQSVREFCEWEGVSQAAFYSWRSKLPGGTVPESDPQVDTPRDQRALFVPVISGATSLKRSGAESREASAIVVMILTDGTRIEMPASDHRLIARVVKSVAGLQGGDR